jgi:hypothetical protein
MLKQQIKEELRKPIITKLSVFDFDGTLIDTPLPSNGPDIYQQKTGKPWPHGGWWSKLASLDSKVFDMPVIPSVKKLYDIERAKKDTLVVMITGRIKSSKVDFSPVVKSILDSKGFHFDMYLFNTGGETGDVKIKYFNDILKDYPSIKDVLLVDDRVEHVSRFQEWGDLRINSGRLTTFNIELVPTGRH